MLYLFNILAVFKFLFTCVTMNLWAFKPEILYNILKIKLKSKFLTKPNANRTATVVVIDSLAGTRKRQ